MKVEITSETKNPLLSRTEVEFSLVQKVTPSRAILKGEVAKAAKGKVELTVIDIVDQKTGSNLITGKAKIYDNEKSMKKLNLEYKNKRGVVEKKEEATAPAEAAKSE
jgi:ribosomal protein S24E